MSAEPFNWVDFSMPCPHCGTVAESMQTRDVDAKLDCLTVHLSKDVANFFFVCERCTERFETDDHGKTWRVAI
jgi:transcription elongation factor Elf1